MTNDTPATLVAELPGGGRMPLLGYGTFQMHDDEAVSGVTHALAAGYRHLDTATGYRNQAQVGAALRDSGVAREDVFITTKLPPGNVGQERRTLEESLTQLGIDQLDLWLIHWPPDGAASVPAWREFVRAQEEGLVRDIGVSNHSPAQLDELAAATDVLPAVNQIPWDPFRHDPDLLAAHAERNVVLEGYSPFRKIQIDHPLLVEIGERHGKAATQVILRWHLEHGIVVIPKSATAERIKANVDIFDFALNAEEVASIDALASAG